MCLTRRKELVIITGEFPSHALLKVHFNMGQHSLNENMCCAQRQALYKSENILKFSAGSTQSRGCIQVEINTDSC